MPLSFGKRLIMTSNTHTHTPFLSWNRTRVSVHSAFCRHWRIMNAEQQWREWCKWKEWGVILKANKKKGLKEIKKERRRRKGCSWRGRKTGEERESQGHNLCPCWRGWCQFNTHKRTHIVRTSWVLFSTLIHLLASFPFVPSLSGTFCLSLNLCPLFFFLVSSLSLFSPLPSSSDTLFFVSWHWSFFFPPGLCQAGLSFKSDLVALTHSLNYLTVCRSFICFCAWVCVSEFTFIQGSRYTKSNNCI